MWDTVNDILLKGSMTNFLSKTERAYLVSVAAFTSLLCIVNFSIKVIHPILYPLPFGIYDMSRASLFPLFHLLLIPLPLLLFRGRRFIVPGVFILVTLVPAYMEFGRGYSALLSNRGSLQGHRSLELLLMIANPLDYAIFVLGNILCVWICSIIIRSFTAPTVA